MAEYKGASTEGGRATAMARQRVVAKEDYERQRQAIEQKHDLRVGKIGSKFATTQDAIEDQLKQDTVGLVTLDDFTARRERLQVEREKQLAKAAEAAAEAAKTNEEKKKKREQSRAALSFNLDEDEDGASDKDKSEEMPFKKFKVGKNPDVDTSFLPDRGREEAERAEREQLRQEWVAQQEKIKNEDINITYSFWDGSGHRKNITVKKGYTVQKFLEKCLEQLRHDFPELRAMSVDGIMYIKEDLIIPQHYTFYDFIVNKARGKSGPLFSFDVHEDIRLISDANVEKDESHAGKVLLRSWYERHKHIFPASRWEPYDPEKKWEKYTIHDLEKKN